MNIVVNGVRREVEEQSTVAAVLGVLGVREASGVAVARNGDVVLRQQWDTLALQPDDRIEVLHAVQGG